MLLLVPSVFLNIDWRAQNCKTDPTFLTSLSEEPFPAKSFGTVESGPVHCPHGYVSGDAGADKVKSSRQVSRLYAVVVAAVEVAGAAVETVFEALILVAAEISFSLDGWGVDCRFARRDTQTPTTTEQTMRMISAIMICTSSRTLG
jgi:hypothetical protein